MCGTIERSSCSRSQGHSTRRRRVSASRAATAAAESSSELTRRRLGAGRGGRRRGGAGLDRAGARRRRRLRRVLAVLRGEVVTAVGLVLPALAEVLDERVERLLLVLRGQQLLDRRRGLGERLLRGLGDLVDLEDVVAELGLHGTLELPLLGLEDRLVERLLLLALGDGRQLAALRLGGVVDRVLLRDALERLPGLERGLRLLGLRLRLGQHDAEVTPLGLRELRLVLVVVILDLLIGDGVLALGHLVADLVRDELHLHAQQDVVVRLPGVLEELLVVGGLREGLLLLLVERLLDLGVGHLDALLVGLLLEPLIVDQEAHDLLAQLVVLLLALLLVVRVGLLRLAFGRLGGRLLGGGDALGEVRRVRGLGVRTARLGGDAEPVLVLGLLDVGAVDRRDGVARDAVATSGEDGRRHKKGAERQQSQLSSHDRGRG